MLNYHRTKRIILSMLLVTSCILAFCFAGFVTLHNSTAWFADNTQVHASGMNIELAETEGIRAEIRIYPAIGRSDGFLFFSTTEATDAKLPQYSTLDNIHRHLLLHIHLPASHAVTLTAALKGNSHFMDGRDGHTKLGATDNFISNILCFANVSAPTQVNDYTPADGAATNAYRIDDPQQTIAFATEGTDGHMTLANSLTIADGDYADLYILVSYSEELLTRLYAANLGNSVFATAANGVTYTMDFTFILSLKEESND